MNIGPIILIISILLPPNLGEHNRSHWVLKPSKFSQQLPAVKNEFSKIDSKVFNFHLAYAKNQNIAIEDRMNALIFLIEMQNQNEASEVKRKIEFACFRYRKGLEVLKMLYEKVLALDHHFSSLRTFRDIHELSNPNSYPEFANAKIGFKNSTKKKSTVELPSFLDNNPFVSVGYTLIASIFGEGNKKERTEEIEKISCLLDFTISMHSDMKIIYYETDFLRASNNELKQKCRDLFSDYTKVISYSKSLDYCRNNDDWDKLFLSLDKTSKFLSLSLQNGSSKKLNIKMNNLEFSVDRLIKFVENYEDFIYQGEQYYQKFKTIINSYENRTICSLSLPTEFNQLEEEISYSIKKFRTAYNMAELQGSKLRDLIYGKPEDI